MSYKHLNRSRDRSLFTDTNTFQCKTSGEKERNKISNEKLSIEYLSRLETLKNKSSHANKLPAINPRLHVKRNKQNGNDGNNEEISKSVLAKRRLNSLTEI